MKLKMSQKHVQQYGEFVCHPRCRICGLVMPALTFTAHDLRLLASDEDARLFFTQCDACYRKEYNVTPVTVIRG